MAYDLQKESDVKEYIEKLGIEYRFGCYSEKKPDVCHLLGDYLESIKKDFEKASKVYRSNCDDYGYGKSCLKFGHYSFLGKGKSSANEKGDPKQAFKYYERGCDLKDPESCLHSGLLLVSKSLSSSIERDVKKGFELLTKACKMDNANACFYLSGMYISGVPKKDIKPDSKPTDPSDFIVQKDMKKAFEFATRACDMNNMYACANLSQMYQRGDGTEKNEQKAADLKKKALGMQDEIKKQQRELKFQQGIGT
ncbi:CLUMA_CG003780, isoform A [Clunio marinus]|uniref:CLUMA_CG003780, isoform A n=1 Tax=Clunio marinus TaxID=568069 RepID=A0A1J1HPU8_9DIPT|nr:CLUMA_CG003780, isoform A [Clunio marinus]